MENTIEEDGIASKKNAKQLPEWSVGLGLIAANFFFGSNIIAVKQIAPRLIAPVGLSFARMFFTALLLLGLGIFKKQKTIIDRNDYSILFFAALLGISGNQLFSIYGISLTNPIHASLLIMATPIIVSVMAAVLMKEGFGKYKIIGLLLGVTGATLLIMLRGTASARTATVWGDLMVIGGAFCYSGYLILIRSISSKYSTMSILRIVFIIGALCSLPFTIQPFIAAQWSQFAIADWYALFHVVILATFCAYLLMNYGVTRWGPSRTGSFIYFQPLFGTLSAIVMVNQTLNATILAAAGLIILGVIVTLRK
jgi:drug/metabolite transporter (DMT)-like permease